MRSKDVPQDNNPNLAGARKAIYARDDTGEYVVVASNGWEVEETVTTLAIGDYNDKTQQAFEKVRNGLSSPLEYHMYANRLNPASLAQSMGIFQWRVKRHLKPRIFKRLDNKILSRYADVIGITVPTLIQIPQQCPVTTLDS